MLTLEGVLGITDPAVSLVVLETTFFLEMFAFTSVPEEQLLDDDDGLVGSVLRVVEEPKEDGLELIEGFGTALRGPITPVTFDPCIVVGFAIWLSFCVTVTSNMKINANFEFCIRTRTRL